MIKIHKKEMKRINEGLLEILSPFYHNNHKLRITPLAFLIILLMISVYLYQKNYQNWIMTLLIIIQTIFLIYLFENQKEVK